MTIIHKEDAATDVDAVQVKKKKKKRLRRNLRNEKKIKNCTFFFARYGVSKSWKENLFQC